MIVKSLKGKTLNPRKRNESNRSNETKEKSDEDARNKRNEKNAKFDPYLRGIQTQVLSSKDVSMILYGLQGYTADNPGAVKYE